MTMNEKRQKKYPDTDYFHFYNANPKGKMTTDCVVRAITTALNQPYDQTLREMVDMTIKTGYMLNENKGIDTYMKSKGWTKCKQPKKDDGTKYTGKEFCRTLIHPIYSEELQLTNKSFEMNRVLANIGGHHIVAIMSGQIWDTWNSADGSIGIVWVKTM
jgi:hypothetical protein